MVMVNEILAGRALKLGEGEPVGLEAVRAEAEREAVKAGALAG